MRVLAICLLAFAYTYAQLDNTCDVPLTCSDSDQDEDADFDSTVEFPEADFKKSLEGNETVKNLLAAYVQPSRIDVTVLQPSWFNVCPSYYYTIYQWSFYDSQHGRCYVVSPIPAARCSTTYCRYIVINSKYQIFQNYYRCYPYYRRVYFWAYCPYSQSGAIFIYTYRYVPGGCNCRRYICPVIASPTK